MCLRLRVSVYTCVRVCLCVCMCDDQLLAKLSSFFLVLVSQDDTHNHTLKLTPESLVLN